MCRNTPVHLDTTKDDVYEARGSRLSNPGQNLQASSSDTSNIIGKCKIYKSNGQYNQLAEEKALTKEKTASWIKREELETFMPRLSTDGLSKTNVANESDLVKLWNANPDLYQRGDRNLGAYDPSQNLIAIFSFAN